MASLCSDELLRFKEKILQYVTMIYCGPFSLRSKFKMHLLSFSKLMYRFRTLGL